MAQIIKSTPGAIGYVDFADAKAVRADLRIGQEQGRQLRRSVDASASAAAGKATVKPDLTFSAIWAVGRQFLPDHHQSWVLVYQKQSSANTTKLLKAYIGYLVGDGQKLLPQPGLRAAALQHRPAGQGTAQQDRLVRATMSA